MSDPRLVSNTGKAIEEAALRKFNASLIGEASRPSSQRYNPACQHWTGMTDPRRPRMIVHTAGARILARHQRKQFAGHDDDAAAVADDHAGAHEFARLHVDPLQIQALRIAEYASVRRLWTFGQLPHSKNSAIQSPGPLSFARQ